MSPAHSSPPPRRPALPAFLGGGRPPRHTLVCITSLRGLRRLVLLSLLGQLVVLALVLGLYRLAGGFRVDVDSFGTPLAGGLICRPASSPSEP